MSTTHPVDSVFQISLRRALAPERRSRTIESWYSEPEELAGWIDQPELSAALRVISSPIAHTGFQSPIFSSAEELLSELDCVLAEEIEPFSSTYSVTVGAYPWARKILRALASAVPKPDILIHPDGEIALEWFASRRSMFTISISAEGVFSYAGLFDGGKVHGRESIGINLPSQLLDFISRVLGEAK